MLKLSRRGFGAALSVSFISLSNPGPTMAGEAYALTPVDRPALTEVGPVIVTDEKLIFSDGAQIGITELASNADPDGQLNGKEGTYYAISESDVGASLPFDTCEEKPFRYVLIGEHGSDGFVTLMFGDNVQQVDFFEHVCRSYLFQRPAPVTRGPGGEELSGKWILEKGESETGKPVVGMILPSDTETKDEDNSYAFIARCRDNSTEAFVAFKEKMQGDALMTVIDIAGQPRKMEFWGLSQSKDAVFVSGWAGDLLKSMVKSDKMTLNFAEQGRTDFDVDFDLRGMEPGLRELAAACNWDF